MPSRPFPILFHASARHFEIYSRANGRPRCAEGRIRPNDPEWGFPSSTVLPVPTKVTPVPRHSTYHAQGTHPRKPTTLSSGSVTNVTAHETGGTTSLNRNLQQKEDTLPRPHHQPNTNTSNNRAIQYTSALFATRRYCKINKKHHAHTIVGEPCTHKIAHKSGHKA